MKFSEMPYQRPILDESKAQFAAVTQRFAAAPDYAAAKAGLIGMTKSAAKELGSRSVTVNAVAPGFIETDMTAALAEDVRKAYVSAIPLGRLGSAQDVADAVAFLASDKASYITGQVIAVNGGLYC